ncbi:MAG: hypothetical protein ACKVQR_13075 [Aquabacterium sp.]
MALLSALGLKPRPSTPRVPPAGPSVAAGDSGDAAAAPKAAPPASRTKNSVAYENDKSGWGLEFSDDDSGTAVKISKTLVKEEVDLGVGLLHGKVTASASLFGQGVKGDDGVITGTVGPEVKATAGVELGFKGFNVALSGQTTATADFWTVSRSAAGNWTVAGAKPISISIALVGEATVGSLKYACEPIGSYEIAIFDLTIPALYQGKGLKRLQDDVESIVGKLPEAARTAAGMVPPDWGGGPMIDPGSPLANEIASVFEVNHLDPTAQNPRTDDGQVTRGQEQGQRMDPYQQQVAATKRLDARETVRQAQIKQWRPAVASAKKAAINASGWFNGARKKGLVSPEAEKLGGQAYTQMALLESDTDHFELACKDPNYEPQMIGTHAQKRIGAWNAIQGLFDQAKAANRA